ncbi:MAG: hypothetical protein VX376_05110 [Pseudomonadota bacterium]|jgi:hypothetical protein|nr:hypothetical protein [Pseudomonadota bacterium]
MNKQAIEYSHSRVDANARLDDRYNKKRYNNLNSVVESDEWTRVLIKIVAS